MPQSKRASQKVQQVREVVVQNILDDMLKREMMDVVFDVHKDYKILHSQCKDCKSTCLLQTQNSDGYDIFGNTEQSVMNSMSMSECLSCNKNFPSQRFAQHLEKCLGFVNGRTARSNGIRKQHQSLYADEISLSQSSLNDSNRKRKNPPQVGTVLNSQRLLKSDDTPQTYTQLKASYEKNKRHRQSRDINSDGSIINLDTVTSYAKQQNS
ncbi:hypothetical protein MIR68_008772 [Amoeboaphelidium protococcarum]|nr:hypothetical protein MIR68_008772 [Amoeboaphelidium protococcarum]